MTYVISDLHGYPLEKLKTLLAKANFGEDDFLYILGDVIDRNGDGGIEVLEWLLSQNNARLILGNHEEMLLICGFLFDEITNSSSTYSKSKKAEVLANYRLNGGDATLASLIELNKKSPQAVGAILDYLRSAPLYKIVTAGGRKYLLLHGGLDNFSKSKKLSDYSTYEILWAWPELDDEYFDDMITVFGHTPTVCYGQKYKGKIIKTKTWIDIDMGAADGVTEPVLLCLDNMKEFRN